MGAKMEQSFPNIELCLLIGICAIVPQIKKDDMKMDALLGDVVLSTLLKQYDLGKFVPGNFTPKYTSEFALSKPQPRLAKFFASLKVMEEDKELRRLLAEHILTLTEHEYAEIFKYPGYGRDHLYVSDYNHRHRDGKCPTGKCTDDVSCDDAINASCVDVGCDWKKLVERERISSMLRLEKEIQQVTGDQKEKLQAQLQNKIFPQVFLGTVGSGDTVMKMAAERDRLAKRDDLIAFEMEGAGLWSTFPTVVIKGACDYGDSHKKKHFQRYAAATAAACAKAFIQMYELDGHVVFDESQETVPVAVQNPAPLQPNLNSQPHAGAQTDIGSQTNNIGTKIDNSGTFIATKMYQGGTYHAQGDMHFG